MCYSEWDLRVYKLIATWIMYSTTIGFNIFAATMYLPIGSGFVITFRAEFCFISMALQNIMACRVVRLLRLGVIQDDLSTTRQLPTLRFIVDEGRSTQAEG